MRRGQKFIRLTLLRNGSLQSDFNPFVPEDQYSTLQTVQIQMRRLIMSRLIRIFIVCHAVVDISLKPLFATMDVSKLRDGRVHFRTSGVKGLTKPFFLLYPHEWYIWQNHTLYQTKLLLLDMYFVSFESILR